MYMIRTQILFPEELYQTLKYSAYLKGISLSELIRRSVQNTVKSKITGRDTKKISGGEFLISLARKAEKLSIKMKTKAPTDLSSHTDHYLYG